ncbi:Helicase-associated domain protein [Metarhizium album ARSEF 1941]|uniref:RNA helicase n=1 Tax=Metarhizium album (strain ARSEF 1941) TaxID=1081103 RepID=A0A0B2WR94_METAS|nr:Helicase-associated domain protein [Metarhizium album ARSEF 1941]KHN98581.1 Helicase-associated domain protein [Metarhizium album ARSEF 1941]
MPPENTTQRPTKRRKTRASSDALSIGGKIIPLDGYLSPSNKKADVKPGQLPEPEIIADHETKAISPTEKRKRHHETKLSSAQGSEDTALLKTRRELPIWQYRQHIQEALLGHKNEVLILVGETGSGKSTQVPQFLYRQYWCKRRKVKVPSPENEIYVGGCIAITQPRRVAATTLAYRVSQEAGTPLVKGRTEGLVGYSVRFDHQVPRGTKIKFLTEGTLLQELLRDPYLRRYSAVIIDEIHERSVDVDLLVGFLKQILSSDQKMRGGVPLKVVIMSATADVDVIQSFFNDSSKNSDKTAVKVLRIEGRHFPVEVAYEAQPVSDIQDSLVQRIFKIHTEEPLPGDILAFLTGQEEIESTQKLIEEYGSTLASNVPKVKVFPLYGQLSIDGQREAFLPARSKFTRKIVLATNIAETSVTVPGVRYVVDSGKAKIKQYRPRLGMESLLAKPISKSSAVQRTGRAGREAPGKCFRLYTEKAFDALQEADLPEILRNDVLGAVLTMKARGIQDVLSFPLIDAPEAEALEKALLNLHYLGALDDEGCITSAGEKMARLPIPPALGAVLLAAEKPEFDCVLEVIDIISCITSGEDIFLQVQSEEGQEEMEISRKEVQRREGDLITYLTTMQQYCSENANRTEWCRQKKINMRNMKQALNIRRQLRGICLKERILSESPLPDPQLYTPLSPERAEAVLRCFLRGYALKTAMLAPDASYVTVYGKHVVATHPASVLHGQKKEAIMFLDHVYTNKNYVKKVSAIRATWIEEALQR